MTLRKYLLLIIFFKKHPKSTKIGCISPFFSKKVKKMPNLTKIGCIPNPYCLNFIFADGLVAEGNTTFFFLGFINVSKFNSALK